MSRMENAFQSVRAAIDQFEAIVDAHEHLAPERDRLQLKPDVCFLFSHYLTGSLHAAGFHTGDGRVLSRGEIREFLLDTARPVEERFAALEPFIGAVRYTAYAEAMWRTLRDIYGFEDITRDNYLEISRAMAEANKPGIYGEILVKRCRIKYALTQQGRTDYDEPYMVPVLNFDQLIAFPNGRRDVEARAEALGAKVNTLDDYVELCRLQLEKWRDEERVVGMKTRSMPYREPPEDAEARGLFAKLMGHGRLEGAEGAALYAYLREKLIDLCGQLDLVVCVHAGVWDDFRQLDPRHNIPLIIRYPHVKFDIYHMGMPWVRDVAIMGGNWHNVYINWCWTHIVSFYMARSAIAEYVDFVPASKIIAFGGDYSAPTVEKVYGHLSMAKDNVAWGLAQLVADGRMSVDQAIEAAHMWFYDNPVRIYGLERLG